MGFAILILLAAISALICGAVGLSMLPLHRRSFSAMTSEERGRYRRGLIIALAGTVPLFLILIISLSQF